MIRMPTKHDDTSRHSTGDQDFSALEEANEKGYVGHAPDDRPNESYTVEGVLKAPDVDDDAYVEHKAAEKTGEPASGEKKKGES